MDTKQLYAGKVVAKSLLVKQHQKDKVSSVLKFEVVTAQNMQSLFQRLM